MHSEVSDIGDNPFGMSDFANYSTSQGYSQFDNSALPRFFTPTSEVDVEDNPFGTSDFASYSTDQGYSQFDSSALPHFSTPTSEVDVAQSWTPDAQTFSAPFADRAVDANIFLPSRRTPQISRDTTPQPYYLPYVYQNQDASIAESDFTEQSTHFVDILKLVYRNTSKL